jgi:hypothetical protein
MAAACPFGKEFLIHIPKDMGKNAACAVGQVPFTFVAMWDIL